MIQLWRSWRQDRLLQRVVRSSGYLFSSNSITVVLSMFQGILVARLVGMDGLGLITTVTVFVSNIHRLMSFRLGEVVVQNFGEALEHKDPAKAIGTIRWSIGIEMITNSLAVGALILLAPWAARVFAKDPTTVTLFYLYGMVLLGNLVYETSVGVMQALRYFDRLAFINIAQSILTAGIILLAYLTHQGVLMVLIGYLVGKVSAGIAMMVFAIHSMNQHFGKGWFKLQAQQPVDTRNLLRFAINTNLQGTVNLFTRDNIPLLLAALRPQVEVGYFKLALSIINFVMLPVEPFIWPTYTEITRTIANHQWHSTRKLLRQISLISAAWTLSAGGFIFIFGSWLIPFVYGVDSKPSYPAFLLLFLGYGFANILNWNRPLLLALNKPGYPLIVSILVGFFEMGLIFMLVPLYGYLMQAFILSGYFIATISIVTWRGLKELRLRGLADANDPLGSEQLP